MKTRRVTTYLLACTLTLGSPPPVRADDTEIFAANPTALNIPPNVLIILDNSANWSASFGAGTKFSSEIATISSVIGTLDTKGSEYILPKSRTRYPGLSMPFPEIPATPARILKTIKGGNI